MPTFQRKDSQVNAIQLEDTLESSKDVINFANGYATWAAAPCLYVMTPDGQRILHPGEYLVELSENHYVIRDADDFLDKYELYAP